MSLTQSHFGSESFQLPLCHVTLISEKPNEVVAYYKHQPIFQDGIYGLSFKECNSKPDLLKTYKVQIEFYSIFKNISLNCHLSMTQSLEQFSEKKMQIIFEFAHIKEKMKLIELLNSSVLSLGPKLDSNPAQIMVERRKSERLLGQYPVDLITSHAVFACETINLSFGGLKIKSDLSLEQMKLMLNQVILLEFQDLENKKYQFRARIVASQEMVIKSQYNLSLRFFDMNDETRLFIVWLINQFESKITF